MASAQGGFTTYPTFVKLITEANIVSTDAANNRSLVRGDLYIDISGGAASASNVNVSITVNGVSTSAALGSVSYSSPSSNKVIANHDVWVSHNANGELGSVSFSASATSSGWGSASNSGSLTGFTNFDRSPSDPTFASLTRTVDAVAVSVNAVSSPAGTATYVITRSENGGAYGDTRSSTSRSATFSGLLKGSTQQFRVVASNSDGSSATTTSSTVSIPNVPTAPSITTTAPSGRALNVSSGVSANNGATVTGYFVQLSADDGATWETAISIPSRAYRFEDLAGGTNVKFRVYSENEMGFSAFTVTDSIFIPSGGRRLTADGFISTQTFTRLTASGPVPVGIAKRLTVSGWVELS
jgi:hypothetical protein